MDNRFQKFGFAANYSSNAFKILGKEVNGADTILRLDSPGCSVPSLTSSKGVKRKWALVDGSMDRLVGPTLSLGLGRPSSSSDSKGSSATACTTMSSAKETDEESSMDLELDFSLHLGCEKIPSSKKSTLQHKVDLELSLSTGPSESDITSVHLGSTPLHFGPLNVDEGSMSSWKSGISVPQVQISPNVESNHFLNQVRGSIDPSLIIQDLSSTPKSSVTCTSGITQQQQQRSSSSKICQIEGCGKGARGASGRCISHGGGRRCQKSGCHKGAEGRTVYCKAHGGGRRCEYLGCTKSAEGRTDFCIAHGGGRRCSHEGCTRAARGKSGLCIRHGGGKRCQHENCTKSAEGLSGLCISHGGGRRCQALGCTKGAQGSTMFCKAHGGGKRCTALGCTKGAEGSTPFCKGHGGGKRCGFQGGGICTKSVHGGTNFCVAHGGGKRCQVPDCTKSARGRTNFCVRHGGGKRCKIDGCSKSAQGSTDFCKAHGGGKRCSWAQTGPEPSCYSFARGKTGLCVLHSGLVQDKRVHGGITLGPVVNKPEKMKGVATACAEDMMNVDVMKTDGDGSILAPNEPRPVGEEATSSASVHVPEGRVHGGSLMAMLKGSSGRGPSSSEGSDPTKSYIMPKHWV